MSERQQIETELSAWRRFWRIVLVGLLCGLVIFMWSLTPGCVPFQTYQPMCRHQALLAATTLRDLGIPVRIAVGPTGRKGVYHAQAQALLNGEWVWLRAWGTVETGEQETNFTPERTVTIEEAQKWR
jgi:hypothetical protein